MIYKIILAVALLVFACTGDQGPVGHEGPQGPAGRDFISLNGFVGSYDGSWFVVNYSGISEDDMVLVFISYNRYNPIWNFIDCAWEDGRVYGWDPDHDYNGWFYWVIIFEQN